MGTNYFWQPAPHACPTCKRDFPKLHIGLASAGRCFSLRIHPELGISSLEDWEKKWEEGGSLVDESDGPVSIEEMLDIIALRIPYGDKPLSRHTMNGAVAGPGTWDLCNYDFS